MNILLIGSGGREHAIAWKLSQNPKIEKIYCAPGNGGTALEKKCQNIKEGSIEELINFAKENKIHMTIVGPEEPLIKGIVDRFNEEGLRIFGPSKKAASLEGSKNFSKEFMKKYGVLTAEYATFNDKDKAMEYLNKCTYPIVIKADGIAGGKGVVICGNLKEAEKVIEDFMVKDIFNGSGKKVIIEEFLEGVEASILSITDGETIIPFISAKDHKKVLDNDKGPNTGGMGVIAPNPFVTDGVMKEFIENILKPTIKGIKEENMEYKGFLFFGLMITRKGIYLLEYNVRLGDPETQGVLPLMESDLYELIEGAYNKNLKNLQIKWNGSHSASVVMVSSGYPGEYIKGFSIEIKKDITGKVFIGGGALEKGNLKTSGGRVLTLVSLGDSLEEARICSYKEIKKINFENMYYRRDIGLI
ncbi:phosphoribosylamine--glycine ligase [Clostridium amazonitimonense]|uniref:phosphoribosylamine--glycine ligase n=1 Tax=Clostridium amazonitimonense TaxID=1499689 RepID=UPI0005097844|nr:phosphoribosylamine--glycine ligase [Clostridium amazonitimonense]